MTGCCTMESGKEKEKKKEKLREKDL